MAEQIDELMVKLGLDTDSKQFSQAGQMFSQLQSRALQFGAVIGTGFGLRGLTTDFVQHNAELADLADTYDTTEDFISSLGFALGQVGGNAEDSLGSIRRMADLVENVDWGEIGGDAFREGFDPMRIREAENLADAYMLIAEGLQGMDAEAARRSLSQLGFGEAEIRLLRQGPERMAELLAQGQALRPQTPEMGDLAQELDRAMRRFTEALGGTSDELSMALMEDRGLAESIDNLTQWLTDNRQAIREFADEAIPILTGMATALGVLVAIQGGRAALGLFANVPGAVALTAGVGMAIHKGMGAGGQDAETVQEHPFFPDVDLDEEDQPFIPRGRQQFEDEFMQDLQASVSPSVITHEVQESLSPSMMSDDMKASLSPSMMMRGGGTTINIPVDARGSRSPMETEQSAQRGVERAIERLAENTITDIRGSVA